MGSWTFLSARTQSRFSSSSRNSASNTANGRRRRSNVERLEARQMLDSTVVFSELMYNPLDTEGAEWIEFHNQLSVDMDLSEWQIRGGVEYEFPDGTILGGGDYLVVASDPVAVAEAHELTGVLGPFTGRLDNNGEELRLFNNDGRRMNSLDYSDSGDWPVEPDGGGASLTKPNRLSASEDFQNWTYSDDLGGSPGRANEGGESDLQFNEVASAMSETFFVEIMNDSSRSINVADYVLSVSGENGGDVTLPAQSISAGSRIVINSESLPTMPEDGDRVFLYTPNKAELLDARTVTNSLRGRSEDFGEQWLWPDAATPGSVNTFAFNDDVVINEIMYHAPPQLRTADQPFAESTEEWIELYNRGSEAVDLGGWRLRDAIDYDIPAEVILQPNEFLVIAKDADAVKEKYGIENVIGNYDGVLSNNNDRIRLSDANKNPVDNVHYFERGHWPEAADGGGSSLELQDPAADNSKAETWQASESASRSEWTEYTYTGRGSEPLGCCSGFNEWVFGLLDSGEFLLDDVSLRRSGSNTQLIQNGTFSFDIVGREPEDWRFVGNHSGTVIEEPGNPTNKVVHVVATGAQQIVSDYVSTTFANNTPVRSTSNYTISFRAKWLSGNQQVNNRLYLTRMSNTAILDAPDRYGTPGTTNSMAQDNIGPTYDGFRHSPIQPSSSQDVTVTVDAADADGVANMTLWYRVGSGGWRSQAMSVNSDGQYEGEIPNQSSNRVVQFYVEGTDSLGATSTYPRRGRDSRALYQVAQDSSRSIETLRFIVIDGDRSTLRPTTTRNDARNMSNRYVGSTLVRDGNEVYYDVEARQIGSRWIRPNSGYKIRLRPDQKFNGVHESLRFDTNGLSEIILKQMVNRAGGSSVSLYDDIARMVSPFNTSNMLLGLARYEDLYLDEQFENGTDGTKWELDDITYPTNASPSPEGTKQGQGSAAVSPQDMRDRGDDPESYRGQLLIKNNRTLDDFQAIADFVDAINKSGSTLRAETQEVMDVDLWMRHYATQAFVGNWDTYGFRRAKNLRIYKRPSDGKIIPLFWDADLANLSDSLIYNGGESRLDEIRNLPENTRLFWGHMIDLVDRAFNGDYVDYWADHYNQLGAGTSGMAGRVANRATQAVRQAESAIPPVAFRITTNDLTIDESLATIRGNGWIDVRQIRHAGSEEPLNVRWTDEDSWEIEIPVALGENQIELQAFDFRGNLIASDGVNVTSTAVNRPLREKLRITEINFNPAGVDDTEFVELMNIESPGGQTFDLAGVRFTEGIRFDFTNSAVQSLAPGERVVVVKNQAAFVALYGNDLPVAGTFEGSLANDGEEIVLVDAGDITIHRFEYNDGWEDLADGEGYSLNIIDPEQPLELWDSGSGWRLSEFVGGSPGLEDNGLPPNAVVINEISNNDTAPGGNWIELHNTTDEPVDIGNWYLSDDAVTPQKFRFLPNTMIDAGGYLVISEQIDFGAAANVSPFTLRAAGGELYLQSSNEEQLTSYIESRSYGGATQNLTQGLVETSDRTVFSMLETGTRGESNSAPRFGPIVINEIMYNAGADRTDFVELYNLSNDAVPLNDGNGERWGFTRGLRFEFPVGAVIGPNDYAVAIEVSSVENTVTETTVFRLFHEIRPSVPVFGYTSELHGVLDNGGETLAIGKFDAGIDGFVEVDRVRYDDELPWPSETDGTGSSLTKRLTDEFGNEPLVWGTGNLGGTPGSGNAFVDTTPPSAPSDLVGGIISDTEIGLAWTPSVDNETQVGSYNVYQDGALIGTTPLTWFRTGFDFADTPTLLYEISAVNIDGVEGPRSSPINVGAENIRFQFGANGYQGAVDAEIREGDPNSNNGTTDDSLEVDGEDGGTELAVLLRWDDISIPAGSQVVGALFSVNITNTGNAYDVSRLNRSWEEGQVTWNRATSGTAWQSPGATGNSDRGARVGEMTSPTITFNAAGIEMVQDWIENPATNHGIIVHNPGGSTDGVDFDSREVGSVSSRPSLNILYLPGLSETVRGDFTLDGIVDERDITSLCHAIRFGSDDSFFDLDGSPVATQADLDILIRDLLGSEYGDANLDGIFNSTDLVQVFAAGEFEDNRTGQSTWSTGDWDCDGEFSTSDLVVAFAAGGFSNAAVGASLADVPNADSVRDGEARDAASLDLAPSKHLLAAALSTDADGLSESIEDDDVDKSRSAIDHIFASLSSSERQTARLRRR